VSRYSASASEIVAGALKNHKRAIIVGDKSTHGKGTVQSLIQMNLPFNYTASNGKKSAAKITIQKYYLPSGESTQIQGVKSDIFMPSINHYLPIGESDLENSLKCDSIAPVNFRRPVNEFVYRDEDILELQKNSIRRQETLPEFEYLKNNVDWYKNKRMDTTLSLSLKNRLVEKKADKDFTDTMNDKFNKLLDHAYFMKNLSLDIVDIQKLKSLEVRGENNSSEIQQDKFTAPKSFDIRLHESFRIMSDWIDIIEKRDLTNNLESSLEI
jgi:carboxyl-terminal processing protease